VVFRRESSIFAFMNYQTLISRSIGDAITVVSFNRPEAANALNTQMALELKDFFSCFSSPIRGEAGRGAQMGKPSQISPPPNLPPMGEGTRAVVLTGQGKYFCAGADLKERQGMDENAWRAQHYAFEEALHAVLDCKIPVIAAVNGAAFGGGLELALACDFIYAADNARFAFSETTLGIIPGLGGTQNLPRRVGMARAREIIFTGKPFSAAEAFEWGMINRLCTAETLLDDAIATAQTIAANAPLAIRAAKRAINEGITLPIGEALDCELSHYNTLLPTHDRSEGVAAFNEKRKPVFRGE